MTIHKMNPKVNTLELCEIVKALWPASAYARGAMGDRFDDAVGSAIAVLVERIEAHYLPEKKKYEVKVFPNICECVEVEALDEKEARDIACGIVDKKYPDHDGMRIPACNKVK